MKGFDELLSEVLREDARVEVPAGMERRIVRALSEERKLLLGKRSIWVEALAATLLLGLAGGWALKRFHSPVPDGPPTAPVVGLSPAADGTVEEVLHFQGAQGARWARAPVFESRRRGRMQRRAPRLLAPLQIEPLVIKPIEIASLTSSNLNGKGEVR